MSRVEVSRLEPLRVHAHAELHYRPVSRVPEVSRLEPLRVSRVPEVSRLESLRVHAQSCTPRCPGYRAALQVSRVFRLVALQVSRVSRLAALQVSEVSRL